MISLDTVIGVEVAVILAIVAIKMLVGLVVA
jgi:hypothetical protein